MIIALILLAVAIIYIIVSNYKFNKQMVIFEERARNMKSVSSLLLQQLAASRGRLEYIKRMYIDNKNIFYTKKD